MRDQPWCQPSLLASANRVGMSCKDLAKVQRLCPDVIHESRKRKIWCMIEWVTDASSAHRLRGLKK
ncbi:hypothetical protein, partial [Ktedonobacter robiniae]|uniref:hypothetical protein n=1 Tax=Ktedonobacter robiniae TaxID=2778365 RepID=UPI001F280CB9